LAAVKAKQRTGRVAILAGGLLGWVFFAPVYPSAAAQAGQAEEALLEEINQLPPAERQARLVGGAKKEGAVTWYVAMNRAYAQDLINVFEADYPFLKVNALTASGGALLSRVLTEYRARSYLYDVFNTRSTTINTLRKADAIMRYRTPHRRLLRDGFYDKEGFFNGIFATPLVFIFNTKLTSRKEAPRSIEDLANPKWTGKLALDTESYDWLAALMDYYGEEKGMELARKIGNQKLNVRRGPTLLTQLVAAGEFPVEIDGYQQEAIAQKKKGAPIDYNFPEPFVPAKSLIPIYMASRPPHPHAAALLADFLMSKKGQEIMYGHGRWVAHKEIRTKGPDDIGDRKVVIPAPDKWGDRYQELVELYNKLLLRQ
jgi:iron(III) transport system substrate-binding protein